MCLKLHPQPQFRIYFSPPESRDTFVDRLICFNMKEGIWKQGQYFIHYRG